MEHRLCCSSSVLYISVLQAEFEVIPRNSCFRSLNAPITFIVSPFVASVAVGKLKGWILGGISAHEGCGSKGKMSVEW